MLCPLCGTRKARRTCPALGRQICSVCCGTKRLTEIHCPPDCPYLSSAREHPPAIVQRQQQRDLGVLLPALQGLSEAQTRLFFLTATVVARVRPEDLQRVLDEDLADATAALAATFETAQRGVIYEHRPGSPVAQKLSGELKTVYSQIGADGGSRFERDAAAVLRAMEQGARGPTDPESPTGYLDLLRRVVGPEGDRREGREVVSREAGGIIIPGSA